MTTKICPSCRGNATERKPCEDCRGSARNHIGPCPDCDGEGYVTLACRDCQGKGVVPDEGRRGAP
jgi:DnaJ-class molecular chaperone